MSVHWDNPSIAKVLRRLASFTRLVTYDQQGLGRSDPIDIANPPSIDDLATDLEAVMDAAAVSDPVLFGMHNGGAVAITYALRHPVRQLIVCNTWARLEEADDFPIGISSRVLDDEQRRHETDWGRGRSPRSTSPGTMNPRPGVTNSTRQDGTRPRPCSR